jgi:hypothetical protein
MCNYIDLKNGSLSLDDVCLMNMSLDVQDINERIARDAAKRKEMV